MGKGSVILENDVISNEARRKLPKKRKISLQRKLVLLAVVPVLVSVLVLLVCTDVSLKGGMKTQALDGLELMAKSVKGSYENLGEKFTLDSSGNLCQGSINYAKNMDTIDKFAEDTNAVVTVCYGKTRKLTTILDEGGKRIIDTDISDKVWEKIQKGEIYRTTDIVINGDDYYACYVPLKNPDGSIIGSVFAGKPAKDVASYISIRMINILILDIIIVVAVSIIAYILVIRIARALSKSCEAVEKVAEGDLTINIDETILKRNDEIGDMGRSLDSLIFQLRKIVGELQQSADELNESGNSLSSMAGQSNSNADEISRAVEEISKGAVSQSSELETATGEITAMSSVIESIVGNVDDLTNLSKKMREAGDVSLKTIGELSASNDRTTEAVGRIARQIKLTNESVEKIGEAAGLITSIASQTKLLSLNASIESARAGEAGRGFAVVAGEIQQLAVQSDETATEIRNIIATLEKEAQSAVEAMDETDGLIKEQQVKLDDTKKRFDEVNHGIEESQKGTEVIHGNAVTCDGSRSQVMDIITNISAISQENAASTEETTASMEELNATINMLAQSAENLRVLSEKLRADMEFFTV